MNPIHPVYCGLFSIYSSTVIWLNTYTCCQCRWWHCFRTTIIPILLIKAYHSYLNSKIGTWTCKPPWNWPFEKQDVLCTDLFLQTVTTRWRSKIMPDSYMNNYRSMKLENMCYGSFISWSYYCQLNNLLPKWMATFFNM